MKKLVAVSLAFIMVLSVCFAFAEEIDLTGLSFEELAELENRIIKEMMSKPEYKEVIVPLGVYKVGVDIPVGKWTISGTSKGSGIVVWGKGVDEYGVEIPYNMQIADFTHWKEESIDWDLVEGTYIAVTISPVKFTPYIHKSLGF